MNEHLLGGGSKLPKNAAEIGAADEVEVSNVFEITIGNGIQKSGRAES